jgi:signal transduction histidine kinase
MRNSLSKDLLLSLALSVAVAFFVFIVWSYGPDAAEFLHSFYETRIYPSTLIQVAFLFLLSLLIGYLAEKHLFKKYQWHLFIGLMLWILVLAIFAGVYNIGVLFFPGVAIIILTVVVVHLKQLWMIDSALTDKLSEIVSSNRDYGGKTADLRLESSLRLLETLLPSSEAVIFEFDSGGGLVPIGRMRKDKSNISAISRQSAWREGIQLCEQVLEAKESVVQTDPQAPGAGKIALPLIHDEVLVGVLLVHIKQNFDSSDRYLLESFSEQIARNFRRREFLETDISNSWHGFLSSDLAQTRLDLISLYHSFNREQRFGALASSYLKEAHAIAYLDGTIAYLNSQMRQMAGLNFELASEIDFFQLLSRFKSEVFNEPTIAIRKVVQSGESFTCDIEFPEKKQTLNLQIMLVKIPRDDQSIHDSTLMTKPICFLLTVRDISAVKENEKLRSDMVSLMSHELRTPITSIKGFTELLLMDEQMSYESREFLQIISNESQRLSKMLTTFLSVSNLEQSDKKEMLKTPVKLDNVVHEVIEDLQDKAKTKRIRLVEQSNSHLPPIAADKGLISRAVTHLIENAIKYSPDRTSVIISTIMESDFLRVVVEDRGYGIPNGELEKIWQKFYRVTRDGHDKEEESTGLGLSFVKEAVEQHGGEVEVQSEVGQGSKFSFTLPRL